MVSGGSLLVFGALALLLFAGFAFADFSSIFGVNDSGPSPAAGPAFYGLILEVPTDWSCVAPAEFVNLTIDGVSIPFTKSEYQVLNVGTWLFIEDSQLRGTLGQSHTIRATNDQIPVDQSLNFFHEVNGEQIFFALSAGC